MMMIAFLERLSIWYMLNFSKQIQIQKYGMHEYKTPQTACVQTIMLKHPTKLKRWIKKNQTKNYVTIKTQKSYQCIHK